MERNGDSSMTWLPYSPTPLSITREALRCTPTYRKSKGVMFLSFPLLQKVTVE